MKRLLPFLCLAVGLTAPATAAAVDEVTTSGARTAALSYDCGDRTFGCRAVRVRIARGQKLVLDRQVKLRNNASFGPATPRPDGKRIVFRQLDTDREPEVLLDLFTGGAHCCSISFVFDYSRGAYKQVGHRWNDPAYALRNLDRRGQREFVSADSRFGYLYASYVESAMPIQVWRFTRGKFRNVTRRFRNAIRKDRRQKLKFYEDVRRRRGEVRGALAAYQADQCLLGRRSAARGWRLLDFLAKKKKINRVFSFSSGPFGKAYVRHLRRKLRRFRYCG